MISKYFKLYNSLQKDITLIFLCDYFKLAVNSISKKGLLLFFQQPAWKSWFVMWRWLNCTPVAEMSQLCFLLGWNHKKMKGESDNVKQNFNKLSMIYYKLIKSILNYWSLLWPFVASPESRRRCFRAELVLSAWHGGERHGTSLWSGTVY